VQNGYRGCGLTNAAVEYPEPNHPARAVAVEHKRELRRRLNAMAAGMGAEDPEALADGLLLLIEGAFVSSQLFGAGGARRTGGFDGRQADSGAPARPIGLGRRTNSVRNRVRHAPLWWCLYPLRNAEKNVYGFYCNAAYADLRWIHVVPHRAFSRRES
jgi:hypothetical protein